MSEVNTEQYATDAYIKLHEDVKQLILNTVCEELQRNQYGALSSLVQTIAAGHAKAIIDREIQNYRIVYRGNTAGY